MTNQFQRRSWKAIAGLCLALSVPGLANAFEFNGFADVTYTSTDRTMSSGSNNGFGLGQLDFYVSQQIAPRLDVLSELVVESPGEGFVVDLERLQIGYAISNTQRLRAGRFHNLLGYWNTAYHHGAQLHTSVGRPFFLEFEDENGIVPVHMVGLWWSGRFDTGLGRLKTGLMFGNGASISADLTGGEIAELNPNSAGDADNDKAVSWNLSFGPAAVSGLEVGFSGQIGKVNIEDTNLVPTLNDEIDQFLWAADLVYITSKVEFLSEYFAWSHDSTALSTKFNDSDAYYAQLGIRVSDNVTPYVRYESLDANSDPYFDAVGMTVPGVDRHKSVTVLGVRRDMTLRSALKAEYRAVDDDYEGTYNEAAVQWSFAF